MTMASAGAKEPVFSIIGNMFKVTLFPIREGINEGINSLFEYIKNNPNQRVSQIGEDLGIPAKTLERWIKKLKENKMVEYRGSKKTGGYFVKDDGSRAAGS